MKSLKLGSLFDGSGGFPLAGVLHGIEPVWASEIEPFPIRVTKNRFPNMKHLGSVTDINGAEIEPVDIITFGSPCQDLSVAGKQLGIHEGQRSNLFFEAIRIIKEMREHDRAIGRADNDVRPRFAVWENVPGAFSSNKGRDFQAVLQALCSIRGGQDHIVPMPPKNKWLPAGCIVGNGWSVAWRVYDAQFWGVPQRRKRIYLIADFGSERAGEILFECESGGGDSAQGGEAGEGTAANAQGSAGGSDSVICIGSQQGRAEINQMGLCPTITAAAGMSGNNQPYIAEKSDGKSESAFNESGIGYWMNGFGCLRAEGENRPSRPNHVVVQDGVQCLNPWDCQSKRQYSVDGVYRTLDAGNCAVGCDLYNGQLTGDKAATLNANSGNSANRAGPSVCYPNVARTLTARHNSSPCVDRGQNVVCVQNTGRGWWNEGEVAETLRTPCGGDSTKANLVVHAIDCRNMCANEEISGTIQAKNQGGHSLNYINPVCYPIENHPADSRIELLGGAEPVQTLTSRMGTGGGNVPYVLIERENDE